MAGWWTISSTQVNRRCGLKLCPLVSSLPWAASNLHHSVPRARQRLRERAARLDGGVKSDVSSPSGAFCRSVTGRHTARGPLLDAHRAECPLPALCDRSMYPTVVEAVSADRRTIPG